MKFYRERGKDESEQEGRKPSVVGTIGHLHSSRLLRAVGKQLLMGGVVFKTIENDSSKYCL